MTIGHCHSERALRDWRIFACRSDNEIPRRSKKLLCRNDNRPLSFWRSFLATEESFLCRNDNEIPRRSKKTSLSEWQRDSSSKQKQLLCRNDKKIPRRSKKLLCRNDNRPLSFWRSFLATEESFLCRNYEEIPRRSKNSFSVGLTKKFFVEAKTASLSEWQVDSSSK